MLSNYGNSNADFTDLECTIKKKMRTTLVSALFIQFGTYYFCSISYYYYYITPTVVGWCIAILHFFFTIIIIIIIIIIPHIFVRSISRRCLDQTLWNLVGISYAMWSCPVKGWFFQNGCRCHGNGQNAKKIEKHKNYHSRLLAEQKLMKLDRNNIHI